MRKSYPLQEGESLPTCSVEGSHPLAPVFVCVCAHVCGCQCVCVCVLLVIMVSIVGWD